MAYIWHGPIHFMGFHDKSRDIFFHVTWSTKSQNVLLLRNMPILYNI